jgi:hypothetical protein
MRMMILVLFYFILFLFLILGVIMPFDFQISESANTDNIPTAVTRAPFDYF